jgi:hypothetical protein
MVFINSAACHDSTTLHQAANTGVLGPWREGIMAAASQLSHPSTPLHSHHGPDTHHMIRNYRSVPVHDQHVPTGTCRSSSAMPSGLRIPNLKEHVLAVQTSPARSSNIAQIRHHHDNVFACNFHARQFAFQPQSLQE